jgi:hypothetical protein
MMEQDHYEPEMADPGDGDMFGAFEAAVYRAVGHEWVRRFGRRQCKKCGRWHGASRRLDDGPCPRKVHES